MAQHVNIAPKPLRQFRGDISPALEETILKALRRKRADRWPTMKALIDALESLSEIDVGALRAERALEAKSRHKGNAYIAGLGMSAWQAIGVTGFVFLCLFVTALLAYLVHGAGK